MLWAASLWSGKLAERSWALLVRLLLTFPPMSEHLAGVGAGCLSRVKNTCTHPHTHIHNCMLYNVPTDVMATPYTQQEGRCSEPNKCHGNFFFFFFENHVAQKPLKLIKWTQWGDKWTERETEQGKGKLGETQTERERERDGSASCSRAKVALCFRERERCEPAERRVSDLTNGAFIEFSCKVAESTLICLVGARCCLSQDSLPLMRSF